MSSSACGENPCTPESEKQTKENSEVSEQDKDKEFSSQEIHSHEKTDTLNNAQSTSPQKHKPIFKAKSRTPKRKRSNRCIVCSKKVSLMGIRCKCGQLCCPKHRGPESHECSFDWKEHGRQQLHKQNPAVRPQKVATM
eukprot:gb/GECH01003535.1/.p1 GENE.gb/GECH01003535.1/~~gb/GECH01003535.1/.p1  ORF type:complete len:138 (+),score=29.51 gb/GECH01003535.1/:1-414(+)